MPMAANSQGSFKLLSDTFGPVKLNHLGAVNNGAELDEADSAAFQYSTGNTTALNRLDNTGLEGSSTHSSMSELTEAQERGIRTQFRDQQPGFGSSVSQVGKEEDTVKVGDVHVRAVPGDVTFDSPASIASSTQRFFLGKDGHQHNFSVGSLQTNSELRQTMRAVIRREHSGNMDHSKVMHSSTKHLSGDSQHDDLTKLVHSEPKTYCCMKCIVFVVILGLLFSGLFLLIFFKYRDNSPSKHPGQVIKDGPDEKPDKELCSTLNVKLRDPIFLQCVMKDKVYINPTQLRITPPVYVNKGRPLLLQLNSESPEMAWVGSFDITYQSLSIQGPAALCSSVGLYDLQLLDDSNATLYSGSVQINVISEVLKVNVSLDQTVNTKNTTDFTISCSTNSGCEQSFVDFFAEFNKEEQYLRGVNFSCIIMYNDYDGYSVSCTGTIPEFLMSQFSRITCRPRSTLLDDLEQEEIEELEEYLELPECDIAEHCGFKCKRTGDYFMVNSGRCDIFHRCYNKNVYTQYCAPGTFFDPSACACRHVNDLAWCQDNGAVKKGTVATLDNCVGKGT